MSQNTEMLAQLKKRIEKGEGGLWIKNHDSLSSADKKKTFGCHKTV